MRLIAIQDIEIYCTQWSVEDQVPCICKKDLYTIYEFQWWSKNLIFSQTKTNVQHFCLFITNSKAKLFTQFLMNKFVFDFLIYAKKKYFKHLNYH